MPTRVHYLKLEVPSALKLYAAQGGKVLRWVTHSCPVTRVDGGWGGKHKFKGGKVGEGGDRCLKVTRGNVLSIFSFNL